MKDKLLIIGFIALFLLVLGIAGHGDMQQQADEIAWNKSHNAQDIARASSRIK